MIFKNDAFKVKTLFYIRLFFISFAIFLTFYLGKFILPQEMDLIGKLAGLIAPIMFFIIIILEACLNKFIYSIEINNESIIIKYGNGYINKTFLFKKNEIYSFNVSLNAEYKSYILGYSSNIKSGISLEFDTVINVYLKNGKNFLLKDNYTELEITKLLCLVQNQIPNFKFESTIHKNQNSLISIPLTHVRKYYDQLLNQPNKFV